MENSSQKALRGVTCCMGHTALDTVSKIICPALTQARQVGTRFTYSGGMEGWVDLGVVTTW